MATSRFRLRATRGRTAEDMQPVADLQLLQLAQMIVELPQRRRDRLLGGDAAILVEPGGAGSASDFVLAAA